MPAVPGHSAFGGWGRQGVQLFRPDDRQRASRGQTVAVIERPGRRRAIAESAETHPATQKMNRVFGSGHGLVSGNKIKNSKIVVESFALPGK